jgi:hypothetical protein
MVACTLMAGMEVVVGPTGLASTVAVGDRCSSRWVRRDGRAVEGRESAMKYTLILAADPAKAPAPGSPEEGRFFQAFFAFNQEIEDKGVYLGGEPLQDRSTATTIRVVDGQPTATDGPFAETKEQIGGFYLLECADLDEALAWAAKVPTAALGYGAVEVRPCIDYTQAME